MDFSEIINKVIKQPNAAFFYTPPIYGKSKSYLFLKPEEIVTIKSGTNLNKKLKYIDELTSKYEFAYSMMNYEAGYLFEKSLNKFLPEDEKLIQFFFYDNLNVQIISSTNIKFNEPDKYRIKKFRLSTSKSEFTNSINKIKSYIKKGDTYQVNYTVKGKFDFEGSYSGLFSNLVFNQSAKYTAIINNNGKIIISLSPELFFEVKGRKIISKPMKGTARRGINNSSDEFIKYELQTSEKNRAENVMIVDLIRNDLGRISEYGSVTVNNLFEVEKYESVYQMVSTIESKLKKKIMLSDILKNIFPCGSITGAPKIRTMQLIKKLEKDARGIYTGGIGLIRKKSISYNVPIRTLCINKKNHQGEIGLGSGVVWDSIAEQEFEETKLKGKFLTDPIQPFQIIETAKIENREITLLNEHLDRMAQTADYFLFGFKRNKAESYIKNIVSKINGDSYRLRIQLDKSANLSHSLSILPQLSDDIKIIISQSKIYSHNKFQYFKTTNRLLYDKEHKKFSAKNFFDVIYFNEKGELAEGSITNIFIYKNELIYTPPLSTGILSGIYRSYILKNNFAIKERKLYLNDLLDADKIVLTNSVRGEVTVNKLFITENEFKQF